MRIVRSALALLVSGAAAACGASQVSEAGAAAVVTPRVLNLDVEFVPDELVLSLPATGDPATRASCLDPARIAFLSSIGADLVREYPLSRACRIRFRTATLPDALRVYARQIEARPELFGRVEANHVARLEQTPITDDDLFGEQWGLGDIEAVTAWSTTKGTETIRVAVVDSGIDHGHPDLADNVWSNTCETTLGDGDTACSGKAIGNGFPDDLHGYNFVDAIPNAVDTSALAHGNMVAGVIGAVTDNDEGVAGVSWHVSLMALKFAREGKGLVADAAEAIRYAVLEDAHVINASFSTEGDDSLLLAALQEANAAGVLVVAAAATDDGAEKDLDDFGGYPCVYDLPNVLCVTSVDENHVLASSWGATTVDLAAPGMRIYSTFTSPLYRKQDGTSMAAPFVSGVAALVLSHCPGIGLSQLRSALLAGLPFSSPPGRSTVSGKRVNARLALEAACPGGPDAPTRPGTPVLLEP